MDLLTRFLPLLGGVPNFVWWLDWAEGALTFDCERIYITGRTLLGRCDHNHGLGKENYVSHLFDLLLSQNWGWEKH